MNFLKKILAGHKQTVFISKNVPDAIYIIKDITGFDIESIPLLKRDQLYESTIKKIQAITFKELKEIGFYEFLLILMWDLAEFVGKDNPQLEQKLIQAVKNLLVAKLDEIDENLSSPITKMFISVEQMPTKDALLVRFEKLITKFINLYGFDEFENGYLALREGFMPYHCASDSSSEDYVLACVAVKSVFGFEDLSVLINEDENDEEYTEQEIEEINSYTMNNFLLNLFREFDEQSTAFEVLEWEEDSTFY